MEAAGWMEVEADWMVVEAAGWIEALLYKGRHPLLVRYRMPATVRR